MKVRIDMIPRGTALSQVIPLSALRARMLDYCQRLGGDVWTGFIDERQICCWGLCPPTVLSNTAYLWMYFNEEVRSFADLFVFIRRSQIEIHRMLKRYPIIIGHCEIGNVKAMRWLRWLGAVFGESQGKLIPFTIRKCHG